MVGFEEDGFSDQALSEHELRQYRAMSIWVAKHRQPIENIVTLIRAAKILAIVIASGSVIGGGVAFMVQAWGG